MLSCVVLQVEGAGRVFDGKSKRGSVTPHLSVFFALKIHPARFRTGWLGFSFVDRKEEKREGERLCVILIDLVPALVRVHLPFISRVSGFMQ